MLFSKTPKYRSRRKQPYEEIARGILTGVLGPCTDLHRQPIIERKRSQYPLSRHSLYDTEKHWRNWEHLGGESRICTTVSTSTIFSRLAVDQSRLPCFSLSDWGGMVVNRLGSNMMSLFIMIMFIMRQVRGPFSLSEPGERARKSQPQ